jgi:hypothetical protein
MYRGELEYLIRTDHAKDFDFSTVFICLNVIPEFVHWIVLTHTHTHVYRHTPPR